MEEGVVEVGFSTNRVECAPIPTSDLLNEVLAELCTLLVRVRVVKIDLERESVKIRFHLTIPSTHLNEDAKICPYFGQLLFLRSILFLSGAC